MSYSFNYKIHILKSSKHMRNYIACIAFYGNYLVMSLVCYLNSAVDILILHMKLYFPCVIIEPLTYSLCKWGTDFILVNLNEFWFMWHIWLVVTTLDNTDSISPWPRNQLEITLEDSNFLWLAIYTM